MSQCQVCEATTGDGQNLCVGHLTELEVDLDRAGEWATTVRETISRQDVAKAQGQRVSGGSENPMPYNVGASEALDHLRATLVSWALLVTEEAGEPLDCRDTVGSIGRWLHSHVDWIRKHDAAGDFYEEIRDALKQCERVVDRTTERINYGPCGGNLNDIMCPGEMKGFKHQAEARCDTCGETIPVEDLQLWRAAQAWGHLETLPVIVRALNKAGQANINYDKAKKWVQRGRLYADICDIPTRSQLFSPARVLAAYEATPQGKRRLASS